MGNLEDINILVSKLPAKEGGLGLYSQSQISTAAWVSSFVAFFKAMRLNSMDLPDHYNRLLNDNIPDIENPLFDLTNCTQKVLSSKIHDENVAKVLDILKDQHARNSFFKAQRAHPAPWLNQVFFGNRKKFKQTSRE